MFTSKLIIPAVIVTMALILVILLLTQRNLKLEQTRDKVRWELSTEKYHNDYLRNELADRAVRIRSFIRSQNEMTEQLNAQAKAQADAQAKLNEVLHDESVKEWGDDVVPIAVSRLFEQKKSRHSSAAAGAVSDHADVPANHADDQKK